MHPSQRHEVYSDDISQTLQSEFFAGGSSSGLGGQCWRFGKTCFNELLVIWQSIFRLWWIFLHLVAETTTMPFFSLHLVTFFFYIFGHLYRSRCYTVVNVCDFDDMEVIKTVNTVLPPENWFFALFGNELFFITFKWWQNCASRGHPPNKPVKCKKSF